MCTVQAAGERQRLALQVELKALGLLERQAAVRSAVETAQDHIMAMNEKNYKKYVRFAIGQRLALLKQARVSAVAHEATHVAERAESVYTLFVRNLVKTGSLSALPSRGAV